MKMYRTIIPAEIIQMIFKYTNHQTWYNMVIVFPDLYNILNKIKCYFCSDRAQFVIKFNLDDKKCFNCKNTIYREKIHKSIFICKLKCDKLHRYLANASVNIKREVKINYIRYIICPTYNCPIGVTHNIVANGYRIRPIEPQKMSIQEFCRFLSPISDRTKKIPKSYVFRMYLQCNPNALYSNRTIKKFDNFLRHDDNNYLGYKFEYNF